MPLNDRSIIAAKHNRSLYNHRHSERSKAGNSPVHPEPSIRVGDLVYVYTDRDKNIPRSRYLVTMIEDPWCYIKKFVGDTLRANSYKVKKYEVFKVPCDMRQPLVSVPSCNSEVEDEVTDDYISPGQIPATIPVAESSHAVNEDNYNASAQTTEMSEDATQPSRMLHPPRIIHSQDEISAPVQTLRKSSRMRHPPSHLAAFECPTIVQSGILPSVPAEIETPLAPLSMTPSSAESLSVPVETNASASQPSISPPESPVKRKSTRNRRPPPRLDDYVP